VYSPWLFIVQPTRHMDMGTIVQRMEKSLWLLLSASSPSPALSLVSCALDVLLSEYSEE
jgi:hypothetical protein